jgi:cation diffusion facilitator family transporter
MSDSLTSIIVVISAKLAAKKPDREHPFGHGRWELIASLFISFALAMIGYEFLTASIVRFQNKESVVYGTLAIVVTVLSILIKELLSQYAFYLGKKYNNTVITADGWHHRSDSLSSLVVLIGILIARYTSELWWIDSALGVFCAFAIFFVAYQIMKETISKLLGEEPKKELIDNLIIEVKKLYDQELEMHHFHLHNYISHKELTLHIYLDKDMTIEQGHKIATDIEVMIREKFAIEATIHIEPVKPDIKENYNSALS